MVKYNNNSKIFLKKNFLMQKCSFYVSYILKDIFFSNMEMEMEQCHLRSLR